MVKIDNVDDDDSRKRAMTEVYALACLAECPHILRLYSAWVSDGAIHMQTHRCQYGTLRSMANSVDLVMVLVQVTKVSLLFVTHVNA